MTQMAQIMGQVISTDCTDGGEETLPPDVGSYPPDGARS